MIKTNWDNFVGKIIKYDTLKTCDVLGNNHEGKIVSVVRIDGILFLKLDNEWEETKGGDDPDISFTNPKFFINFELYKEDTR